MNFCYADPPYIGQAKKHYAKIDSTAEEVNHKDLVECLCDSFDGWALSLSSPTLREILSYCPQDVRVGQWVKPFCAFKVNVNPAYAYEPVIFWGGRRRTREQPTVRDWVSEVITLKKGVSGVKPRRVCYWIFDFLNIKPEDNFTDMFPGSGAVTAAWEEYSSQYPALCNLPEKKSK